MPVYVEGLVDGFGADRHAPIVGLVHPGGRDLAGGPVFVELGNHERPELWILDLQPFGARRKVLGMFVGSRRLIRARHPIHLAFNRRGRRSHLSGDGP